MPEPRTHQMPRSSRELASALGSRLGADMRCGDCEHFDEEGCPQAAEALLQDGWPRASVVTDASAEAGRCPDFSPSAELAQVEEDEASSRQAYARVAAIKNFSCW